jgi:mannose PTS system EIIA component
MVGILIVAHGAFGESLIATATHVLGQRPPKLEALSVGAGEEPQATLARARDAARDLDEGDGVLLITDICGATPCNVVSQLIETKRVEVVTGASMPMLLRALTYRREPLAAVVAKALSGGTEGVMQIDPPSPLAPSHHAA